MEAETPERMTELPKSDLQDVGYAAVRAALSMIPFAGGAAVELFQFVFQPSLERRRQEWMKNVGKQLWTCEITRV